MKKFYLKMLFVFSVFVFSSCTKTECPTQEYNSNVNNKFAGKYERIEEDDLWVSFLEISNAENNKILLHFYNDPAIPYEQDYIFSADVSNNTFATTLENFDYVTGILINDTLYIDWQANSTHEYEYDVRFIKVK